MFDEMAASASPGRRWFNVIACGLMCLFFILMISEKAVDPWRGVSQEFWNFLIMLGVWGSMSVWWIARIITMFWWRNSIRFCENGVLWDRRFARWDHLVEHRWDETKGCVLELRGIDQHSIDLTLKVPVPPDRREEVKAVLTQTAPKLHVSTEAAYTELGRIPISVAVKHRHFWRFLAATLLRIGIVVAAIILAASIGIREFQDSLMPAAVLGVLIRTVRWKWLGKPAGAPLVRLVGRRSWMGLIGIVAAAAILYFIGANYQGTSEWPAYLAGIGFWWAAFSGAMYLSAGQLDLRENGLVLQGVYFWPWGKVRIVRWDRDGKGRLVLARGWRRVIATVPPEQQDAVDTVLKDKSGERVASRTEDKPAKSPPRSYDSI
jgi:hypothetical protein